MHTVCLEHNKPISDRHMDAPTLNRIELTVIGLQANGIHHQQVQSYWNVTRVSQTCASPCPGHGKSIPSPASFPPSSLSQNEPNRGRVARSGPGRAAWRPSPSFVVDAEAMQPPMHPRRRMARQKLWTRLKSVPRKSNHRRHRLRPTRTPNCVVAPLAAFLLASPASTSSSALHCSSLPPVSVSFASLPCRA